jgi:hypothetical protein
MISNFCTLFDSVYLSRGLVMYNSLKKHTSDFHLYVFAFDELCYEILQDLNLDNVTVIELKTLENNELLEAKKTRTRAEYCWTSTSSAIEYILINYNLSSCTYVDADLFFYRSPVILIDEMIYFGKSVLITEHRYSKLASLVVKKRAGRFCVQFLTFLNNLEGREILTVWKNQCLDWCFNRYEDGKFGDQKYLDVWPEKYPDVHILSHLGGGLAPWNIGKYKISYDNGTFFGYEKATDKEFELIFFHFHYVRFSKDGKIDLGWIYISKNVKRKIYYPYILQILETEKLLSALNNKYKTSFNEMKSKNMRDFFKSLFKNITGFNILKTSTIQHGLSN